MMGPGGGLDSGNGESTMTLGHEFSGSLEGNPGYVKALTCADSHRSKNVQTDRSITPDEIAARTNNGTRSGVSGLAGYGFVTLERSGCRAD